MSDRKGENATLAGVSSSRRWKRAIAEETLSARVKNPARKKTLHGAWKTREEDTRKLRKDCRPRTARGVHRWGEP